MTIPIFVLVSLLAGWCGTVPRLPFTLPPIPKPPRPICPVCGVVGAFGGLGLSAFATQGFTVETSLVSLILLGVIGGRFLGDLYVGYVKK
jgi:hypothetical protein